MLCIEQTTQATPTCRNTFAGQVKKQESESRRGPETMSNGLADGTNTMHMYAYGFLHYNYGITGFLFYVQLYWQLPRNGIGRGLML